MPDLIALGVAPFQDTNLADVSPFEITANPAIDREEVGRYLHLLSCQTWNEKGRVAMLVETPQPHRHAARSEVSVVEGKGFAGDNPQKSFYRGRYVPGREVSAMALEVLRVLGIDPIVVGDNLITEGFDLGTLVEGDLLSIGDVLLERSPRSHRPCRTFRARTSPEAFAVVSRNNYRGALFIVRKGGTIRVHEDIRPVR